MVDKKALISRLKDMPASDDFIEHIQNVDEEESTIFERTVNEFEEDNFKLLESRIPIDGYQVYLKVGAPFASMNKHFETNNWELLEIYDNDADENEYRKQVEEYDDDYYVVVKDPSWWNDVFKRALNDSSINGSCYKKNHCGIFKFSDISYKDKERLSEHFLEYIHDSIGDRTQSNMAKRTLESFDDSLIYKIDGSKIVEVDEY